MKKRTKTRTHKQKSAAKEMRRSEDRAPLETRVEPDRSAPSGGPTDGAC